MKIVLGDVRVSTLSINLVKLSEESNIHPKANFGSPLRQ